MFLNLPYIKTQKFLRMSLVITVGILVRTVSVHAMEQGGPAGAGPAVPAQQAGAAPVKLRPAYTLQMPLQNLAAETVAAGFTQEQQNQIIAGAFDWNAWQEAQQLAPLQADAVKRAFGRNYYLRTGVDLGQLGVNIGGFSIAELLDHGRIPAEVPANGMLNLSGKKINDMTGCSRIEGWPNLQWLDLAHNELREVPVELGQLTNLKWLHLSYNQLSEVPAEIGQLPKLEWLDLSDNQLREVPAELGQLTNLKWLHLSGNQLRELPAALGQLTNLQELDLYGNPLQGQGIQARAYAGQELKDLRARLRTLRHQEQAQPAAGAGTE